MDLIDSERGSGSVLMLGVVAVALLMFGSCALLASAQQASGRARTAADLAALAAASAQARPDGGQACVAAGAVAAANGARLLACTDLGDGAIEVRVSVPARLRLLGPATARSRAGPAALSVDRAPVAAR